MMPLTYTFLPVSISGILDDLAVCAACGWVAVARAPTALEDRVDSFPSKEGRKGF
jgi:hypothetical protein